MSKLSIDPDGENDLSFEPLSRAECSVAQLVECKTGEQKGCYNFFVCLILFFTSTQQSFSYAGRFFLGLTSTKLG